MKLAFLEPERQCDHREYIVLACVPVIVDRVKCLWPLQTGCQECIEKITRIHDIDVAEVGLV